MRHLLRVSLLLGGLLAWTGCKNQAPPAVSTPGRHPTEGRADSDHVHERGKMLIADAGKHHALLTAHLSVKGNELDIFFETADDRNPVPVAIPMESFTAYGTIQGQDLPKELQFECAPAAERPQGEKPGTCSHFVAKASWMKPTDTLEVVARVRLDDGEYRVNWKGFHPKTYAHHED